MKKKLIGSTVLCILMIIFSIVFSIQENTVNLVGNGEKTTVGEITDDAEVKYEIFTSDIRADKLQILFATYARNNDGSTIVEIVDKDNDKVIHSESILNSTLIDNEYRDIELGRAKLQPQKKYLIKIYGKNAVNGSAPTIWYEAGGKGTININGVESNGSLCLALKEKNFNINKMQVFITFILMFYLIGVFFIVKGYKKGIELIYKNRYLLAIILFIICILLEISGSSIGMWNQYIQSGDFNNTGLILGKPRGIRSDEWAVNTPLMLSQYYNTIDKFPYFSEAVRGTSTDMFIVYGQPVWDISVIFRPFHWGYLFLGAAKGLSFFWCGRLIALFLVTFEFGMMITRRNKKLSVIMGTLISLAPIVQWWFAVNGVAELLIFAQLSIIMLDRYMNTESYIKRSIYAFICSICAGGYVLIFYPSWQVPIAYLIIILSIWVILKNYKKTTVTYKDILIILGALIFVGVLGIYIFNKSHETIRTVMETVYPGSRSEIGGGSRKFANYIINIFFPFKEVGLTSNVCEESVFIDFFPLGLILTLLYIKKEKQKDTLLILLLILFVILSLWCIIPWPSFLAKITLLSNSQPDRTYLAVGLINILMLIRVLAIGEGRVNNKLLLSGFLTLIIVGLICKLHKEYLNGYMVVIINIVLFFSFIVILKAYETKKYNLFLILCLGIMIISGATVNPIQKGIDVINDKPIINAIKDVNSRENGIWISDSMSFPNNNIPLMAGVRDINCTNVYPQLDTWKKIDKDESNKEIYNRYAHININIVTDRDTKFELANPDVFNLSLNINDIGKLDIKYILTVRDLENLSNQDIKFEKFYDEYGYKIYEVKND